MSLEALVAVMSVCLTLLAALVLVLHHLKALHLTKGEGDDIRATLRAAQLKTVEIFADWRKDLDETKSKLSALSNRVR